MIAEAFEDLSQSLRVFLEAYVEFPRLVTIDRAEACGNLNNGFSSVLNNFHSLYDSIHVEFGQHPVDWYATPELCLVLAIRNARHHNLANKIRNVFTYHARRFNPPTKSNEYILIDFEPREEDAKSIEYFMSWSDISTLLSLPSETSRLRKGTRELIFKYMNAEAFDGYEQRLGIHHDFIFFNAVPLVINAGIAIHPTIKNHIDPEMSVESKHFDYHFRKVLPVAANSHKIDRIAISLPE